MSLSETKSIDKIEVLENGSVQVREVLRVIRNDEVIAQSFNRFVIAPGSCPLDADARVKAICDAVHTPSVVSAFNAELAAKTQASA